MEGLPQWAGKLILLIYPQIYNISLQGLRLLSEVESPHCQVKAWIENIDERTFWAMSGNPMAFDIMWFYYIT